MANWQGAKVTNKGTALIAKVTAGNTKLNITRVAFGSGNLTNIEGATRLVREIDNAEIITKVQKNNTCTVTVRLTNANFTAAQNISEIGIFATDPDEGEILFAGMVDANPDFVQAASSSTLVAKTVTMGIGYSNSDNVTITLSNTMWVTAEEVLTMISDELRKYGNNTHRINDAVVAANTAQTITSLTDMIGNRIKAITGESTWVGNPANNIKGIQSSITDLLSLVASLPVTNIKDFNKQVISALDQEKLTALGVKYNFDNPNAWSISFGKLFGGLILQCIKVSGTTGGSLNSGYSEGEKLITYPIPFNELLGFTSGLVDTSATFAEHASVNPNNSNARVFLHALTATNVEITTWLWLVGI